MSIENTETVAIPVDTRGLVDFPREKRRWGAHAPRVLVSAPRRNVLLPLF
jgi:hypothetical protein